MTTHITTEQRVRDDLADEAAPRTGRGWAWSGIVAGAAGFASTILSMSVGAVYEKGAAADPAGILATLGDKTATLVAFHVAATIAALALVPFGLGLHRLLRRRLGPDSLVPGLAAFGLLGTALVVLMGTALDTEFIFGVTEDGLVIPEVAATYNHWIGTVPWVWTLTGLTGCALFAASRQRAVRRWIGYAGLAFGGLSLLLSIAPLQYMSGWTGSIMVLLVGLGLAVGDRDGR